MIRVFADDIKTENQYAKKTGINMEYKNNKTSNRRRYKSRYHSPHSYKTKRGGSSNRAPILIGVATFLILASLVLVFTFGDKIYSFLDTTFHPSALPLSESETMGVVLATEEAAPPAAPVTPVQPAQHAQTEPPAQHAQTEPPAHPAEPSWHAESIEPLDPIEPLEPIQPQTPPEGHKPE